MHRKALGKGLDALFKPDYLSEISGEKTSGRRIINVPINDIIPNPLQPREKISDDALEELKLSISENGILEPPVVRRKGEFYELIVGERRYRAAKELKFDTIEVILMEVDSEDKMLVLSLIENIQREDLNAIEEGKAYQQIINRMGLTQEELANVVGKSRSAVANTLRLLSLSGSVQDMVSEGLLAPGSARALVTVPDEGLQKKLARRISSEGLSARKAEELVKKALLNKPRITPQKTFSPVVESLREDLQRIFATSVKIKGNEGKGKVEIAYHSRDELENILEILRGGE